MVNLHAAGTDIGAEQICVCIPGPERTQIVRTFGSYTADLHALADWLVENGTQTIAMDSTSRCRPDCLAHPAAPRAQLVEHRSLHASTCRRPLST